jgi:hypothetical protein
MRQGLRLAARGLRKNDAPVALAPGFAFPSVSDYPLSAIPYRLSPSFPCIINRNNILSGSFACIVVHGYRKT